ncbi:signal peptidase I [Candidatus Nitrosocaldus islandicus]|jgi:signal peptidase|uniref:Signal peptidase I n=1 Tax=Candidatus Nitrosocaldus cavascurensis TaxID=2058097 RepID=A0A2K5APB7_9ARCH|nr:signal peptidase I [Candidatus Nitrosocaldus islandicus]SPC33486.1 Peptidase S26B, signal peptidase [Candidatus Nitrosocaldus cavascurensis]
MLLPSKNLNRAVKDVIIIVIGVASVWLALRVAFATDNPFYVVSSESMVPTLQVYDVIVVRNGSTFEEVKPGDIIVFQSPSTHDRVIVHRVVKVEHSSEKVITTKGDNNPISIPGIDYPITKKEYIGKVVFVVPKLGLVSKVLSPPVNYIVIGIILAVIFLSKLRDTRESMRKEGEEKKEGDGDSSKLSDVRLDGSATETSNRNGNTQVDSSSTSNHHAREPINDTSTSKGSSDEVRRRDDEH